MSEDEKQDSIESDDDLRAREEALADSDDETKDVIWQESQITEEDKAAARTSAKRARYSTQAAESIIAPTTDEEVAAYRAEHGGMVVHAREAVDKRHLLEAAAEAKVTGDAHDLAEIVEALVERLPG